MLTVDLLTDGSTSSCRKVAPARVGRKALAVNLSDLAAMAARPVGAVVALALPRDGALALAQQLYEGLIPLAEQYRRGDCRWRHEQWDGPLVVSVTLVGEVVSGRPACCDPAPGRATASSSPAALAAAFWAITSISSRASTKRCGWPATIPLHGGHRLQRRVVARSCRDVAEESGCGAELYAGQDSRRGRRPRLGPLQATTVRRPWIMRWATAKILN